jgi:hypothetical protein
MIYWSRIIQVSGAQNGALVVQITNSYAASYKGDTITIRSLDPKTPSQYYYGNTA